MFSYIFIFVFIFWFVAMQLITMTNNLFYVRTGQEMLLMLALTGSCH